MATQALGQALKTNMSKSPAMTAGDTYMQSVDPTLKELKSAEEQKMSAEKEKAIFTGESESRRQQALSKATEAEATAMREDPARAQYEEKIQEKAKAEFIPSQENAQDMAALFSLMNVIGFAIGAGGKAHAQQAMSAMNGMLEGHQKGRDDLYKQQRNIFETNQKQLDKKIDDLYKFMQENTKLYAKDKLAAEQNANAKFAEEGAGFLKAFYEKNGPGPALEYMKQLVKAKEHAADLTDKEKTRAENERFRLQQAAIAAQARKDAAAQKTEKQTFDYIVGKDGKTYAINKNNPSDIREVSQDLSGATKVGAAQKGAGGVQETALRVMQQDIGNAKYNLEDLKNQTEKTGKLPGGSVAFAQKFTGDLSSMLMRYAANQSIDEGLQGSDALMLNLAFDIASAQSGGRGQLSDAKVRAVVSQMPLDEQPESTKATKWAALMTRVKEANNTLPKDKQVEIPKGLEQYYLGSRYKDEGSQTDVVTGLPNKNSKGWTLHNDGKGNYAYVSPDGKQYEEAE